MLQSDGRSMPESDFGKYGKYFQSETVQQCGYILVTMAIIMLLGGATVETLSFAKLYGEFSALKSDTYSYIWFSGYWCGVIILLCASAAIYSASHPSDAMVFVDLVVAIICFGFSVVSFALPAGEWHKVDVVNFLCNKCSGGQMMFAAFGVIISCGCIACIAAVLLGSQTIMTMMLSGRRQLSAAKISPREPSEIDTDKKTDDNDNDVAF